MFFPVVFRNFRHDNITMSDTIPNNFIYFIHENTFFFP